MIEETIENIDVMVFLRTTEPYQNDIRQEECVWHNEYSAIEIMPLSFYEALRWSIISKHAKFVSEINIIKPKTKNLADLTARLPKL